MSRPARFAGAIRAPVCFAMLLAAAACGPEASKPRIGVEVREGARSTLEFRREGSQATAVLEAGDGALKTQVGSADARGLRATGQAGYLQFGPYATLEPGAYRVTWVGHVESARRQPAGTIDVAHDGGRALLSGPTPVPAVAGNAALGTLVFTLPRETNLVEFRLWVAEGTIAVLERVEVTRR